MTPEERLRAGLVDLAAEVRPAADVLAGVGRHIRAERRRRVAVQAVVLALSVVLLVVAGLTVPLLRQHDDPGPAATTTTVRRADRISRGEASWVGQADAQLILAEGIGPARLERLRRRLEAMPAVERVAYESEADAEVRWEGEHGRPAPNDLNFGASLMVKLRDPTGYEAFSGEVCRGGGYSRACLDGVEFAQPVLSPAGARARGEADRKARAAALAEWGEVVGGLPVGGTVPKAWLTSAVLEVAMHPPIGPTTVAAEGRTPDRRRLVLLAYPSAVLDGRDGVCLVLLGSRARERSFVGCSEDWGVDRGRILFGGVGFGKHLVAAGPAPAGTARVRIEHRDGPPVTVRAATVRQYDWAFYLAVVRDGDKPADVVAVDAGGRVLARLARE